MARSPRPANRQAPANFVRTDLVEVTKEVAFVATFRPRVQSYRHPFRYPSLPQMAKTMLEFPLDATTQ